MANVNCWFQSIANEDGSKPDCKLIVGSGEMEMEFIFSQDNVPCENWSALITAIEMNSNYDLVMLNMNGVIAISTRDGSVFFSLSKYGSDNFGKMNVAVPNHYCLSAFRKAYDATKKYEKQPE